MMKFVIVLVALCSVSYAADVAPVESSIVDMIDNWPMSPSGTSDIVQAAMSYDGLYLMWLDTAKRMYSLRLAEGRTAHEIGTSDASLNVAGNIIGFRQGDRSSTRLLVLVLDPTSSKKVLYSLNMAGESLDRVSTASHDIISYDIENVDDLIDFVDDRKLSYITSLDGGATHRIFQTWYENSDKINELTFAEASKIHQLASYSRHYTSFSGSSSNTHRLERWYWVTDTNKLFGIDMENHQEAAVDISGNNVLASTLSPSYTYVHHKLSEVIGFAVYVTDQQEIWASNIGQDVVCIGGVFDSQNQCGNDGKIFHKKIVANSVGATINKIKRTHWPGRLMFIADIATQGKNELYHISWCLTALILDDTCVIDPQTKISSTQTVVDFAPLRWEAGAAAFTDDQGNLWVNRVGSVPIQLNTGAASVNWFTTAQMGWINRPNWGRDRRFMDDTHRRTIFWKTTTGSVDSLYSARYFEGALEMDSQVTLTAPVTSPGLYSQITVTADGAQVHWITQPANGSSAKPVLYSVASSGGDVVKLFPEFDLLRDRYSFSSDRSKVALVRSTGEVDTNKSGASAITLSLMACLCSVVLFM